MRSIKQLEINENMGNYLDKFNMILLNKNYYNIFFENPNEKGKMPNFEMFAGIFFGFSYLKLLDMVLKPTKENVLKKSQENANLYEVATYENGEPIGFYNNSKYDISKIQSSENHHQALIEYVDGFSENIEEIYEKMNFKKDLEFLVKYDVLDDYLDMLYEDPKNLSVIKSYDDLVGFMKDLVKYMAHDEYYSMGLEHIINDDPFNSYYYIHDSIDEYAELLNKLLLYDTYNEDESSFKIYDPNSSGICILQKTKRDILKDCPNGKIELYGKCERKENEIIYLAKNVITKKDAYAPDDAIIIDPKGSIFEMPDINHYDDFDFITSNYVGCWKKEYRQIFKYFQKKNLKKTKVVMAIDSIEKVEKFLDKIIDNDYLESIIHFKTQFIIIMNTDKSPEKKGKFLIIDEGEIEDGDELKLKSKQDIFTNDKFIIFNIFSSEKFSESDLEKMDVIYESYKKFETTEDAILIDNAEYDDDTIDILLSI